MAATAEATGSPLDAPFAWIKCQRPQRSAISTVAPISCPSTLGSDEPGVTGLLISAMTTPRLRQALE